MKVLDLFVYLNTLLSYTSSGDIIPTRDGHNCLIDKGFSIENIAFLGAAYVVISLALLILNTSFK